MTCVWTSISSSITSIIPSFSEWVRIHGSRATWLTEAFNRGATLAVQSRRWIGYSVNFHKSER